MGIMMKSLLELVICIVTLATSSPIPQRLTEEDFGRSFDEDGLSRENNKVDIFRGYAKIRRQGRDHNGGSISFNKPLTVRNPFEFQAGRQNLPQRVRDDKIQKFPFMAPVFDMKAMLKAEAEKLRQKVEEASLMAAQAAEEAEEKVKMIAEEAMKITGAEKVEVDEIIEKSIDSAIDEAKEILDAEIELSTEETVEDINSDEAFNEVLEEDDTTETSEPSSDIDLGSVQEV